MASTLVSEFSLALYVAAWSFCWRPFGLPVGSQQPASVRLSFLPPMPGGALALGCVPALYALVIRLGLPESVRFLENNGRHDEAEKIVRDFEASPR